MMNLTLSFTDYYNQQAVLCRGSNPFLEQFGQSCFLFQAGSQIKCVQMG